jgi:UDP-3-O-[3-hydroxymyristoyl] N-acetylglucosamine deacetylase
MDRCGARGGGTRAMKRPPHHFQTTVHKSAKAQGVGLHSGAEVALRLHPAEADEGIVIERSDLEGAPRIAARPESVDWDGLTRRTGLKNAAGVRVETAEHLLAACLGMELDNVRVELDGPELPIFDGSAAPFVKLIRKAGLRELDAPRRVWRLARPVTLLRESAEIVALPAERMTLAFLADLRRGGMANQSAYVELTPDVFAREVAPARTFVYYEDLEALRDAGLIRGGSLDCAVVIRDGKAMNGPWRLEAELARHKLLDLIGDLAILGRPIEALITARGSGHAMHHEFIDLLRKELTE